jgi:hypothetical protein
MELKHIGYTIDGDSLQCIEHDPQNPIYSNTKFIKAFGLICEYCGSVKKQNLCCTNLQKESEGK